MEKKSSYEVFNINKNTWRIVENNTVNIYLIAGDERAAVLDTGYGNIQISHIVKDITDLPLIVINTHGHPDHSGGNLEFGSIYANTKDVKSIVYSSTKNHDTAEKKANSLKINSLSNNEIIELGNRTLKVIYTPGHTLGSICLYDVTYNYLFTGDTCNRMTWVFLPNSTFFSTYFTSLLKLKPLLENKPLICPGHNSEETSVLLENCIDCAQRILNGEKGCSYSSQNWGSGECLTIGTMSIVFNPKRLKTKKFTLSN